MFQWYFFLGENIINTLSGSWSYDKMSVCLFLSTNNPHTMVSCPYVLKKSNVYGNVLIGQVKQFDHAHYLY